MITKKICLLGGSGFVGKTLANRLSKDGYHIIIPTRNREANRGDLILLPRVDLVQANIHDSGRLLELTRDCDAVINLVGILNERSRGGRGFHKVHVELTEKIIQSCRDNSIKRLLHMSALNADAQDGPSHYLRSKGEAEDKVHAATDLNVTSFRPSVIFGQHDSFFNRFAGLLKLAPGLFPLACANARFAPVFVEDVAEVFARSLNDPATYGKHYELCGPHSYTLRELVQYTADCMGMKRWIMPLPDSLSRLQGAAFDLMGFAFNLLNIEKPFSTDNYLSTRADSCCRRNALPEFGIHPTALESIVPQYLGKAHVRARYYDYRQSSHRPGKPGAGDNA